MSDDKFEEYLNSDNALFHYTKMENGILILSNMELKLSKLEDTNDPYEYKNIIFNEPAFWSDNPEDKLRIQKLPGTRNLIENYIQKKTKMISFCSNENNGFKKSRMWSQYGDNHKGICIVISKEELLKNSKEDFNNQVFYKFNKINYYKKLEFDRGTITITEEMIDDYNNIYQHIVNNYKEIFFRKFDDYINEDEYRLIVIEKQNEEIDFINIKDLIKGVLVGDDYNIKYYNFLKDFSEKNKIPVNKVYFNQESGDFGLTTYRPFGVYE